MNDFYKASDFYFRNSEGLVRICLLYIKQCRYQLDLFQFFESKQIGSFNHTFIHQFAQFIEEEGDPFIEGPNAKNIGCIMDYRYSETIYR